MKELKEQLRVSAGYGQGLHAARIPTAGGSSSTPAIPPTPDDVPQSSNINSKSPSREPSVARSRSGKSQTPNIPADFKFPPADLKARLGQLGATSYHREGRRIAPRSRGEFEQGSQEIQAWDVLDGIFAAEGQNLAAAEKVANHKFVDTEDHEPKKFVKWFWYAAKLVELVNGGETDKALLTELAQQEGKKYMSVYNNKPDIMAKYIKYHGLG